MMKRRQVLLAKPKPSASQSKRKPLVEPRRVKPKAKEQSPTLLWKLYDEAVIESEVRTTVVQLKSKA